MPAPPTAPDSAAAQAATDAMQQAVAAYGRGDDAAAERFCRDTLARSPDWAGAHHLLGLVQSRRGHFADAVAHYDAALAQMPGYWLALVHRGDDLFRLGRPADALASYERALAIEPANPEALASRGAALHRLGRLTEALASYERALALQPDYAPALANRGAALMARKRPAEALASFERALALAPDYPEALSGRGTALYALGRPDEALACYDRALAIRPAFSDAIANRARALHRLGRLGEALAGWNTALRLRPDDPDLLGNRGATLHHLGRFEAALASFDAALARDGAGPVNAELAERRLSRSLLLLLQGAFAEGWREYEWRRRLYPQAQRSEAAEWLGEDLRGKRLLLHCEQGLGDTIQFARFAPLLAARGAEVVLSVQPSLVRLLRTLTGTVAVIAAGDEAPPVDFQLPLLSLGLVLDIDERRIPAETPYLRADPERVAAWSARLSDDPHSATKLRVGLVWAGAREHPSDRRRSIALTALQPLLGVPGIRWISLQVGAAASDLGDLLPGAISDVSGALTDFAETAALVANLDLVISVDTAVAHLAGALARPVWILLPAAPDWRWLLGRCDSLWYPTARLFRQRRPGEWSDVIARAAAELATLATRR